MPDKMSIGNVRMTRPSHKVSKAFRRNRKKKISQTAAARTLSLSPRTSQPHSRKDDVRKWTPVLGVFFPVHFGLCLFTHSLASDTCVRVRVCLSCRVQHVHKCKHCSPLFSALSLSSICLCALVPPPPHIRMVRRVFVWRPVDGCCYVIRNNRQSLHI